MAKLVGRDRERAAVEAFLDADDSGARILLLEGEAGIGKTTVWRAAVEAGRQRGFAVLAATAAEPETQLPFTVLRDLLDPRFDEIANELPGPQRQALAVTLLHEEPPARPLEPGSIAVALTSALRLLAGANRLLVAVDDVQWLDSASAAALAYALRRIDRVSYVALLARRPQQAEADVLGLSRLDPASVETIELGALSMGALGGILHEQLGVTYPRPTLYRVVDSSGGNPLFALELARALEQTPAGLVSGAPLPVPNSLRHLLRARLEALPVETLDALTYLSLMARPRLALLAAALDRDATPV